MKQTSNAQRRTSNAQCGILAPKMTKNLFSSSTRFPVSIIRHWTLGVGRSTFSPAKNELLYSPTLKEPGHQTARVAEGPRLRIRAEAVHTFLRAKKQTERRGLRKRSQGFAPGKGDWGVRAVRAGAENPGRGEARLRGGSFAGDVRAAFRHR